MLIANRVIGYAIPLAINFHINSSKQKTYNDLYSDLQVFGDRLVIYEDGTKIWVKTLRRQFKDQ